MSSPRGGLITTWSTDGRLVSVHEQADARGLATAGGAIWASDGHGGLTRIGGKRHVVATTRWDNHLAAS